MEFNITSTTKEGRAFSTKTGKTMVGYGVKVDGGDTWYDFAVFESMPRPERGDKIIEASVKDGGDYNDKIWGKLVKVQSQNGAKPSSETPDERQKSIVRQHSQEMAIRYLAAQNEPFTFDTVVQYTDKFERDALGIEEKVDTPDIPDYDPTEKDDEIPF